MDMEQTKEFFNGLTLLTSPLHISNGFGGITLIEVTKQIDTEKLINVKFESK